MTKTFEQIESERAAVAARVAARRPRPPEPVVIPPAEVRWRRAEPGELNQGAKTLIKFTEALGWEVIRLYARGPYMSAAGEVLDNDTEAVALVFRWHSVQPEAWCWWVRRPTAPDAKKKTGWSYDGGCIFGPWVHLENAATARLWLDGTIPPDDEETPT